jgi:hypothetical protein
MKNTLGGQHYRWLWPDLAETPPRTCSRAVAQNNGRPPGQQKAITTGEGIGSGMPSTLSQQLPRDSMAQCAKSVGEFFLPEGVTFSSVCFSCIKPHGAVASSLC